MKVISGPEPLTAHELGAKLWNAEYKGKTIGQWAKEAWLESERGDLSTLAHSVPDSVLAELGMLVMHAPAYLHFMHLHKLMKALPEFRPYVATLATWEGVNPHGRPNLKPPVECLASTNKVAGANMKVFSEPEPLTDHELGAKFWNTEYKGATIGQLFLATLSVMRTGDEELIKNCPERVLLSELGLHAHRRQSGPKANLGEPYIHILNARQLYKRIPELERWHSTMLGWYGVTFGGVPCLCEPFTVRRDEPLRRRAKKPMLSLAESHALERLAAATRTAPAAEPAAPAKARGKAKPAPVLSPAEDSSPLAHTATVIQFPGRR